MNNRKLPPALIKANIALFKGEHVETQRALQEYTTQYGFNPNTDPHTPLVLWLDAQAHPDREERIKRLNILLATTQPDNPYSQIARHYLQEEEDYIEQVRGLEMTSSLYHSSWVRITALILVAIALVLTISALFNANPDTNSTDTLTSTNSTLMPTPFPDRSRVLVADSFTARYPSGVLQITALEENSERVVSPQTQQRLTPVPGARFYALALVFECRSGVCNQPPEARIALQLGEGTLIEARPEAMVANEQTMQAIALGRTTAGWVIFEIPLVSSVEALVISPRDGAAFEPILLTLPGI